MANENVLLEILNNRFTGIVEEMGYVIHRASYTVFVKETWDFDSALVTPEGEVFCYPRNIGVTNMLGMHMGAAIKRIGKLEPGDVMVTNDPNATLGMCTHLPDIMMFQPLFYEGKIVCFAWCFVHSSDVGGLVPGSIAPTAYDRFQEGITIPPTKLYKAGELNQEFLDVFLANCRIPEQNWGDMKALLASLSICERRVGQLVKQYGISTVEKGITNLLDYGERRARDIITAIPDGDYEFTDYVEVDFASPSLARIKVNVQVRGSELLLDFTGTDTQVRAAMNLPTHGRPNQWVVLGVVNYLRTADRALPLNRGILRSVAVENSERNTIEPHIGGRDGRTSRDWISRFRRGARRAEQGGTATDSRRRRGGRCRSCCFRISILIAALIGSTCFSRCRAAAARARQRMASMACISQRARFATCRPRASSWRLRCW